MGSFSPLKLILLITMLVTVILVTVSMSVNSLVGAPNNTNNMNATIAFSLFGLIMVLAASVLFLILFFACLGKYRLFMTLIVGLSAAAVLCFSIATGTAYHPNSPSFSAWLLSALWTSVISLITAMVSLLSGTT
ncbi:hypothetical protein P879_02222 [Paragonimus westermani]|uniref:Uncharacterized protein n=1 Tax=Paragonimus westermani TaxID=34504 RepID=A0A8T0DIL1_9TREM|nr:hypothetical protein P879_02222 [Paragonimus westermani]